MISVLNRFLLNSLLALFLLYTSVLAAWYIGYSNYFFFPVIYQLEDIHGHVLEFAPQNREGREDFAYVSPPFHLRIFGKMLRAIENEGEGLEDITYPAGAEQKQFLTQKEIVHLQDVADLLYLLKSFMSLIFILMVIIVFSMIYGRVWPYYTSRMTTGLFVCGAAVIILLRKYGFTEVFYGMHEWLFPENHQWFFYYQDSLMSTVLKTPDVFKDFAVIMAIFIVPVFIGMYVLITMFIKSMISRYR